MILISPHFLGSQTENENERRLSDPETYYDPRHTKQMKNI